VNLASSPLHDRLVFLVGAQRSGTNWLQRLLATHPDVVTLPAETHLFTGAITTLADGVQHGVLGSPSTGTVFMDRPAFIAAARAFCDTAYGAVADRLQPAARRVLERSPNHVEHLALIGEVFPDAWFVHIVRDGRDVTRSLVSQRWGPGSVEDAAAVWARSVRAARDAAPGLSRYCEVRYEDLLGDPRTGARHLFEFLGLDPSDTVLDAVLAETGVAYNTDLRQPEVGIGKWRAEWSERDLTAFERVAGDLRAELGYPAAGTAPRRARRRTVRRLRVPSTRGAPQPASKRPRLPLEARQRRVDEICGALAAAEASVATQSLAGNAAVRIVGRGTDEQARGEAGKALLARVCADGGWGTQRRGDVHVAGSAWTVVLTHDRGAGSVDRVVVMQFDQGDSVTALTVYAFPL
jgi:hypothetical protein